MAGDVTANEYEINITFATLPDIIILKYIMMSDKFAAFYRISGNMYTVLFEESANAPGIIRVLGTTISFKCSSQTVFYKAVWFNG